MKPCSKCGEHKPKSDFFVRNTATGARHAQCKQCYKAQRRTTHAEHYRKNQAAYQQRAKQRRERLRAEFRHNMLAYLRDKSCAICGENDMRVLEFDHIDPTGILVARRRGRNEKMPHPLCELPQATHRTANGLV